MTPEPDAQIQPADTASAALPDHEQRHAHLISVGVTALATMPPGPLAALVERLLALCEQGHVHANPPEDGERHSLICAGTYALMVLPLDLLEVVARELPES